MKVFAFLLLILLFLPGYLYAEQENEEEVPVFEEEVVVTATKTPHSVKEITLPVSVVKKSEILEDASVNAGDVIKQQPGCDVISVGAFFAAPNIRGLSKNRILSLIDGVRLLSYKTIGTAAAYLDFRLLEKIEIVRGPGSVLYGSDAIGGIINFITLDPLSKDGAVTEGSYRFSYGLNNNMLSHGVMGRFGTEKVGFLISGRWRDADNFHNKNGEVPNSYFHDASFDWKLSLKPAGNHRIDLLGMNFWGRDVGKASWRQEIEERKKIKFPDEKTSRITLTYEGKKISENLKKLHFNIFYELTDRHQEIKKFRINDSIDKITTKQDTFDTMGSSLYLSSPILKKHTLTYGTDIVYETPRSTSKNRGYDLWGNLRQERYQRILDDAFKVSWGVYLQDEIKISPLSITAGLRFDDSHSIVSFEDKTDESSMDYSVSGHLGLNYAISQQVILKLHFGRSFRSPSLEEKFVDTQKCIGYLCGNEDLGPETGYNADIGVKITMNKISFEIDEFLYYIDDMITLTPVDEDPCQFRYKNTGKALLAGTEGILKWDILRFLRFSTNLSYVNGFDLEEGGYLPSVPPFHARLSLRLHGKWKMLKYYFEVFSRMYAPQKNTAPDEDETPGYVILSAKTGIIFSRFYFLKGFLVHLTADNITNEDYRNHLSRVDGMGFNLLLAAEALF